MQAHDARMSGAKTDKGIFLREGGMEFVVALEMALVEHFDSIFLSCGAMYAMHDLWCTACEQGGAREGLS